MKKISSLFVLIFLFSSCSPTTAIPEATFALTNTATLPPTETFTPEPTSAPTLAPTATLSPDLNNYQCAENVTKENCDFIKESVRITRYYFIDYLGSDILEGVKFLIINDPKDVHVAEGGSAGTFQFPKNAEPYVWLNVGHSLWTQYSSPEYQYKNLGLIAHEFTHAWQYQQGCISDALQRQPTGFLIEGYAGYIGYSVAGLDLSTNSAFSDDTALEFWKANAWKEKDWFNDGNVNRVLTRHLVEDYGLGAYVEYCKFLNSGAKSDDAFQSAYGISITDFHQMMKDQILGDMQNCTVATCGAGVDNYSDNFDLSNLFDKSKTEPNLIVHFVDANNKPVIMTFIAILKQNIGTTGEYSQRFVVPGTFSYAMLPGRYMFWFSDPGYPHNGVEGHWGDWRYFETDWFDVYADQVTEMTLQIPAHIENPNISTPNLQVKFFDVDGNSVPNLNLVICSYENPVKVCSGYYEPTRHTDSNGVYYDSLRTGKYLLKFPPFSTEFLGKYSQFVFYQILDINIQENGVTQIEYHFPAPNLVIKFLDVNGSPIPGHGFVLCKLVNGVGDCNSTAYNQSAVGHTNKQGVFEAKVDPGEYYVLSCKIGCESYPFDYTFEHIIVVDGQVTTAELPLHK